MLSFCLAVGLGILIIYFFFYKKSIKEKLKHDLKKSKDDQTRKLEAQGLLIKNIYEYKTMQNKGSNMM